MLQIILCHTIEGNSSNTVKRNSYKTDSKSILGYGIPAFPNSISNGVSGMLSEEFKYFANMKVAVIMIRDLAVLMTIMHWDITSLITDTIFKNS